MKDSTLESNSCSHYFVCFGKAIFAGIIATVLLEVLIYLQGFNSPLMMGKMILGAQAVPAYIYLAGGGFCLLVGVVYAILYALILAPMRFIHDFIQAIIFAAIMTAIAIFTFPKLQTMFDTVTGRHSQIEAPAQKSVEAEKSTEVAKSESELVTKTTGSEAEAAKMKQMILSNFVNHLIYAFSVIVIYRRCRK